MFVPEQVYINIKDRKPLRYVGLRPSKISWGDVHLFKTLAIWPKYKEILNAEQMIPYTETAKLLYE